MEFYTEILLSKVVKLQLFFRQLLATPKLRKILSFFFWALMHIDNVILHSPRIQMRKHE